jgi:hypothetical protein
LAWPPAAVRHGSDEIGIATALLCPALGDEVPESGPEHEVGEKPDTPHAEQREDHGLQSAVGGTDHRVIQQRENQRYGTDNHLRSVWTTFHDPS